MSSLSPIRFDWDEDGLHVKIDLDELDGVVLTYENGTIHARMHTGQAWAFYEHVQKELGGWYAEGASVKAVFDRVGGDASKLTPGERAEFGLSDERGHTE